MIVDFFKDIELTIPNEIQKFKNVFSVIVGRNGIGKSRILSEIASKYEKTSNKNLQYEIDNSFWHHENYIYNSHFDEPRIIAVSTSPFDKFKTKNKFNSNYRYIGMRGNGFTGSSSISLISSAARGILSKLSYEESTRELSKTFNILGFNPTAKFIFKPTIDKINPIDSIDLESNDKYFDIDHLFERLVNNDGNYLKFTKIQEYKIKDALHLLSNTLTHNNLIPIDVDFSHSNIYIDKNHFEAILILLEHNLLKLVDLKLEKFNYRDISLRRASSGEQCLLVMMLGIAGHIVDNSIILIDEPEISLHPQWQEEFMTLLMDTFSSYTNCHFIIATHSPQIVSNLNKHNSFIVDLSNHAIYNAANFYNKSSDYQLAELFDAPGYKNEYITRLAFSLLSRIKNNKNISETDFSDVEKLNKLSEKLTGDTETIQFISMLNEVVKYYASNK